jgi:hypothetical protein
MLKTGQSIWVHLAAHCIFIVTFCTSDIFENKKLRKENLFKIQAGFSLLLGLTCTK